MEMTAIRSDKSEAYFQGYKSVSVRRLDSITTYVNPTGTALVPVKTTKFAYVEGPVSKRSRMTSIKTCAGDPNSQRCMPATTFGYSDGGGEAFQLNAAFTSTLGGVQLTSKPGTDGVGTMGILLGDFNGDGKTDFIRWSDDPTQNKLYFSRGDGNFDEPSAFNLKSAGMNLFKSNNCYYSLVADFDVDGLPDILRFVSSDTAAGGACASEQGQPTLIFRNKGNGSFEQIAYVGPVLQRIESKPDGEPGSTSWTAGANFYVMDVNRDGIPDIVTARYDFGDTNPLYSGATCAQNTCNFVYLGDRQGHFNAPPDPKPVVSNYSLYSKPWKGSALSVGNVADIDGDGNADLIGIQIDASNPNYSTFLSNGDGTFSPVGRYSPGDVCEFPLDFNGDGRADCLMAGTNGPGSNKLLVSDGASLKLQQVVGFNLTAASDEMRSNAGVFIEDFNNDGRADILRWSNNVTSNQLYLSKGDGTFTASPSFNQSLAGSPQLKSADGLIDFVIGDFTGKGSKEILRLKTSTDGTINENRLLVRSSATPSDQLVSVTTGTGLKTDLEYMPLSNNIGNRYTSDFAFPANGNTATYPTVDLSLPMYVVTTTKADNGVGGNRVTSEFAYAGLKADVQGRGLLGFREVRRQSPGVNGANLTVRNTYLQKFPYIGAPARTESRASTVNDLGMPAISETVSTYCDASVTGTVPTETAPCSLTDPTKFPSPYLYQSIASGWDIDAARTPWPKVTTQNEPHTNGELKKITVTTEGTSAGIGQQTEKVIDNLYFADITGGDDWILGRLESSTVKSTVLDLRASLTTSPGTGAFATAIAGSYTPPVLANLTLAGCVTSGTTTAPTKATYTCILGNTGQTAAATVTYQVPAGTTYTGPGSCAASTSNCGSVVVSSPSTVGTTGPGTLTATPNTGVAATTASFTLKVDPAQLPTFSITRTPSPMVAGQSFTSIVTSTNATTLSFVCTSTGTGYAGSASGLAPNGTSTGSALAAWVGYPSNCQWTATGPGGSTTVPETLNTVYPATALSLSCASPVASTTPTPATITCTVGNSGGSASSISYSTTVGTRSGGPTSCAAFTANCGTVVVTSPTAAGNYSGALSATPSSGTGASSGQFTLVVNTPTPPALTLGSCSPSGATTSPTKATYSCTLGNSGGTAASSVSYSSAAGTVAGPTSCAANSANCGSVVVSSSTAAGSYTGSLTATPNTGTGASTGSFTLTVNPTPVALSLTGCTNSGTKVSPTPATYSCILGNTGGTAASSVSYSSAAGSVSGPGSCAANSANCGTVTVTSPTAYGSYNGSLAATPNSGSGATSGAFTLTVNPPLPTCTISASPSSLTGTGSVTLTANCSPAVTSYVWSGGYSNTTSTPSVTVTASATTTYWVQGWNVTGGSTGVNTTVTVLPANATVSVNPSSQAFGTINKGSMATYSFTVTNSSATTATGLSVAVTNGGSVAAGDFGAVMGTCGSSLAAGSSCAISVTYYASCTGGNKTGTVTMSGSNFTAAAASLSATTRSTGTCS